MEEPSHFILVHNQLNQPSIPKTEKLDKSFA